MSIATTVTDVAAIRQGTKVSRSYTQVLTVERTFPLRHGQWEVRAIDDAGEHYLFVTDGSDLEVLPEPEAEPRAIEVGDVVRHVSSGTIFTVGEESAFSHQQGRWLDGGVTVEWFNLPHVRAAHEVVEVPS